MTEWSFFMQNENFEVNEELPISMLHNASVSSREKHTLTFSLLGCWLKENWREIYPRASPEKSGTNWCMVAMVVITKTALYCMESCQNGQQ
jgi:hypothetical protein